MGIKLNKWERSREANIRCARDIESLITAHTKDGQVHRLESDGYTLSEDGSYIRRNYEEFHYSYSTPTPGQSGMMM